MKSVWRPSCGRKPWRIRPGGTDLVIVVGDPRSNNSNRLAQVAREIAGVDAYRVADVTEIDRSG